MLKNILEQLYRIIFQSTKAWVTLAGEEREKTVDNDSFFKTYLYPVIGIVALLSFIGVFFHEKAFNVHLALRLTISVLIALFAGFYLASYILSVVMDRYFSGDKQHKLCQRFVGYSSALIYVIYMILAIFPDHTYLLLILLYTVYIVWEGAMPYMQIQENQRIKFAAIASAIILLSPFIIEKIMSLTMPNFVK